MINLHPWNLYILLAAVIATIVVLILSAKPLLKLKTTAEQLLETLKPLETNTAALKTKSDQVSKIGSDLVSNAKLVLTGYILLKAFQKQEPVDSNADSDQKPHKAKITRKGLSSQDLNLLKTIQKL